MSIKVLYNEIDPYCCAWLSNLMDKGHIRPGTISDKSIEDLTPAEVMDYDLAHYFAGIGGWDLALTLAGWEPDGRVTWTGSCPCQPFSAAGKGKGAADERHLWPAWQWLIAQCLPRVIFGEQVEAAIKHDWLDLVQADLEGLGYAVGAAGLPAAGVGAPHGRARLWFVAHHHQAGRSLQRGVALLDGERSAQRHDADGRGTDGELAHREREGLEGHAGDVDDGDEPGWLGADEARPVAAGGGSGGMADDAGIRLEEQILQRGQRTFELQERLLSDEGALSSRRQPVANSHNDFWRSADWLLCRDGKYRPVEPGTFPLAHGVAARVGKLRAYGNAIVPQVAAEVIRAYLDARP